MLHERIRRGQVDGTILHRCIDRGSLRIVGNSTRVPRIGDGFSGIGGTDRGGTNVEAVVLGYVVSNELRMNPHSVRSLQGYIGECRLRSKAVVHGGGGQSVRQGQRDAISCRGAEDQWFAVGL